MKKKIAVSALLMVMAFITMVGMHLTMHAGEVSAEVPGDSNMRGRYGTLSTTPIDDLNKLNGISSNVQDQIDAAGTGTLADTKIFIGSSAGTATAQTVGTGHSLTNAGAMTHIPNTVSSTDILNGTIAALDMASDAVSAPKLFKNVVSLVIELGAIGNNLTIPSGSFPMSWLPVSGFSNDYTITSFTNTGTTLFVNTDAHPADMIANIVLIMP